VLLRLQDSFYKGLTDEQLKHVWRCNFDTTPVQCQRTFPCKRTPCWAPGSGCEAGGKLSYDG